MQIPIIPFGFLFMAVVFWLAGEFARAMETKADASQVQVEGEIIRYMTRFFGRHKGRYSKTFYRYEKQIYEPKTPPSRHGKATLPLMRFEINGKIIEEPPKVRADYLTPETHPIGTKIPLIIRTVTVPILGDMYYIRVGDGQGGEVPIASKGTLRRDVSKQARLGVMMLRGGSVVFFILAIIVFLIMQK
ncbi:MAG: hypothetical protein FWH20_07215 [Oscillospiraceae bacterium]|nr:hypothetical protein [Oscillospiraceae bacterium]